MAASSPVSPGDVALDTQYNNLRLDAISNTASHQHTGASGQGRKLILPTSFSGASSSFTAGAVNTLVAGTTSNADPLHTHTNKGEYHAERYVSAAISATGNEDKTITTNFTAKGIRLHVDFSLPGNTQAREVHGILVFKAGVFKFFDGFDSENSSTVPADINEWKVGDSATFTSTGSNSWSVTFTIITLGATSFIIRAEITETGSATGWSFIVGVEVEG